MQVYLFKFDLSTDHLYVTSDNASHTYESNTYAASAIECKELSFDLKEVVGETNITIPWSQAGFFRDVTHQTLEGCASIIIYEYETSDSTATIAFSGFVNSFKVSKAEIELQCVSFVEFARDNYQRTCLTRHCNHRLFSPLCSLNAVDYTYLATVTTIYSDRCTITISGPTQASGWFTYGYIRYLNSYRYITKDTNNGDGTRTIVTLHPVPSMWHDGVTSYITVGCDKTTSTCKNKFNNFHNFLGFPFAPYESIRFTGLRSESVEVSAGKK